MPKGLYFTAVVFLSFFFFRRLISEVTKRISTKLGHIFKYDCYLKNLVWTPQGIYPPRAWGQKNAFLGWTLNFDRTYLCNRTWYQQSKETCRSRGTPLHAPKFCELRSRNSWESLASFLPTPFIFTLEDTASITVWTLYNRQQANFGACYVVAWAYSLEQQNAGRGYAGLCHASSFFFVQRWLKMAKDWEDYSAVKSPYLLKVASVT